MATLAKLLVGLGIDAAEYVTGLHDVVGRTTSFVGTLGSTIASAGLAGFGQLAGAAADGASAVVSFASEAAQATRDIGAQLGITADEAEALGDTAQTVFANNWGDSIADVSAGLVDVRRNLGELNGADLESVTGKAFALRDAFGIEIPESTSAARTLMDQFGLTSEQAFDFIAKGMQKGLDRSGDFLDSIGEYSVQFHDSGATASEFFSIMETGMQGGMLGTDKIADAFKESRIRIMEMSDAVVDAFGTIGESAAKGLEFGGATQGIEALKALEIEAKRIGIEIPKDLSDSMLRGGTGFSSAYSSLILGAVQAGTISVADAQQIAIEGLKGLNNQVWQNTAGVAIFGTQWEDLGPTALLAIDSTITGLDDMAGSVETINQKYGSWGSMFEGLKRQALVALQPIVDKGLELANRAMPLITAGFGILMNVVNDVVAVFTNLVDYFGVVLDDGDTLNDFFVNIPSVLQPAALALGEIANWLGVAIPGTINYLSGMGTPLLTGLAILVTTVLVTAFVVWAAAAASAAAATIAALAPIALPILAIIAVVALLYSAWQNNFGGIQEIVANVISAVTPYIEDIKKRLDDFATRVLPLLQAAWDNIYGGIKIIVTALVDAISSNWSIIQTVIDGAMMYISGVIKLHWDIASGVFIAVLQLLAGDTKGAFETIRKTVDNVMADVEQIVTGATMVAKNVAIAAWVVLRDTTINIWNAIKDNVFQITEDIREWINNKSDETRASGTEKMAQLREALAGIWASIYDNTIGKVTALWNDTVSRFATKYPETVASVQRLRDNLAILWDAIKSKVSEVIGAVWLEITTKFNSASNDATGSITKIKDVADTMFTAIGNKIKEVGDSIKTNFTDPIGKAKDLALAELGKIVDGIGGLISGARSKASELGGAIVSAVVDEIGRQAARIIRKLSDIINDAVEDAIDSITGGGGGGGGGNSGATLMASRTGKGTGAGTGAAVVNNNTTVYADLRGTNYTIEQLRDIVRDVLSEAANAADLTVRSYNAGG